jgi:uncharacterized protein YacL
MKLRRTIAIIGGIVMCIIALIIIGLGIPIVKSMEDFIKNSCYVKIFLSLIGLLFAAGYGVFTFIIGLVLIVPDKFFEDL